MSERVFPFHPGENCHDKHPRHHRSRRDGQRDRTTHGREWRARTHLAQRTQPGDRGPCTPGRDDLGERRGDRRACGVGAVGCATRRGTRFSGASTACFRTAEPQPIFMDCNAVNPSTLDRIRAAIGQDEHFLDTCIIGSPPKPGGGSAKANKYRRFSASNPAERGGNSSSKTAQL